MTIVAFCDASYSPQTGLGVYGYYLRKQPVNLYSTKDIKNTQLEVIAAITAIQAMDLAIMPARLYTDCQRVVDIYSKYCSQTLTDRESKVYEELISVIKGFQNSLEITHISGHKKAGLKNSIDHEFSIIDLAVRDQLRALIAHV
jgi:ribonuclease HI